MIKNYCIYKISNIINNNLYIGKTKANTDRRWGDHIRLALEDSNDENAHEKYSIHEAISMYGLDNFKFEIIRYYTDENAAYRGEKFYIKKYDSFHNGYNETEGGRAPGNNKKITDKEAKNIIKDYLKLDLSAKELMIKYNLAKPCILDILHRRSYLNVKITELMRYNLWLKLHRNHYADDKFRKNCNFLKLNEEDIRGIFKDFSTNNFTLTNLSEKYDTTISNIKWILDRETRKEVKIHKLTLGKVNSILKERQSKIKKTDKLKREEIKENIFTDFERGFSKQEIANKYNISLNRLIKILNSSCWHTIPLKQSLHYLIQPKIIQLLDQDAINIINKYCNGSSIKEIAKEYNKNINLINYILQRKTFKHILIDKNITNILKQKVKQDIKYMNFLEKDIKNIFNTFASGNITITECADIFNSERKNISNVLNRITYAYVIIDPMILSKVQSALIKRQKYSKYK